MLNPFPEFLTYSLLGPFILRIILGIVFIDLGWFKLKSERTRWISSLEALHLKPVDIILKIIASLEVIGGLMLLVGIYTQIAALALVILTGIEAYVEYKDNTFLKRSFAFYVLLFAISLSLLLTGAGAFAFDIPL